MPEYSEKEPLLGYRNRQLAAENEISTNTCPSFTSLLTKPFQCLPQLTKQMKETYMQEDIIDYSDDDDPLPDLPYTTTPIVLAQSTLSQEQRLYELRKLMKQHNIGVYIIPSEDEHQSEYTALADKRREYISGFTGSAGIAVVTLDDPETLEGEAALSTDGRYFLQAEKQLDKRYWKLLKQGIASNPTWNKFAITKAISNKFSKVISCDPRVISLSIGDYFKRVRVLNYQSKFEFTPLFELNLVDAVWGSEKPTRSMEPVYHLPLQYSGQSTDDKVKKIRETLTSNDYHSSHLIITALDDIAWLFNLRSDTDVPFTPVFFAYAIVSLDSVILYTYKDKIEKGTATLHSYLKTITGLVVKEYDEFYADVSQLRTTVDSPDISIVLPNKESTTYALYDSLPQSVGKQNVRHESIVANTKIFKNSRELFNAKIAQYKDSLAFILFSSWLDHQLVNKKKSLSEYDAACKIYSIREKLPNFKGLSYETISSTGPNAAIIHYAPTKEDNAIIDPRQIYLIDSGAHYLEGTTDITRTYKFGYEGLTDKYKKYYTLVLKGHLAVAMAKFPPHSTGTGTILDAYARQPLWNEGLDFNHGTGHGVGSFGNVHEGPLSISTTSGGPTALDLYRKGGILTDEPGFYIDGEVGFRIESELEIIECDDLVGKTRNGENFLGFGYLTKVPFCRKLIDTNLLSPVEVNWINEYHKSVREDFAEKLLEMEDKRAYNWLHKETEPF
ncbi:peptidase M24, structural domain-containing protein [Scheffersomyces xylosifermentans]|uniref:peptidase M24, structural domain-containing protein n=1 Tax=Scheffersomyces xylosifermentans TaxID=1304137 RepID=UPI00315D0C40